MRDLKVKELKSEVDVAQIMRDNLSNLKRLSVGELEQLLFGKKISPMFQSMIYEEIENRKSRNPPHPMRMGCAVTLEIRKKKRGDNPVGNVERAKWVGRKPERDCA